MRSLFVPSAAAVLALAAPASGQDADAETPLPPGLPQMDIHLASLSWSADGTPAIGAFENVTGQAGYENQPFFTPDGSAFLYSRETAAGGVDIWRYELATGRHTAVLETPDANEFSPTVPFTDESRILTLRQDEDGVQNVYVYAPQEEDSFAPLLDLDPVGYFGLGAQGQALAMFVLGEPHSLQVFDFAAEDLWTAHQDIGRAILASPNEHDIYFTAARADGGYAVMRLDPALRSAAPLFALPGETQDFALHADPSGAEVGGFFVAFEGAVHYRAVDDEAWRPVADLTAAGLEGATRTAVSPAGDWLAVVAAEPGDD